MMRPPTEAALRAQCRPVAEKYQRKKFGIVLASLITISVIAPTIAEAGEMHHDRHIDKHRHHDDHHRKPSLTKASALRKTTPLRGHFLTTEPAGTSAARQW
jgi:hypothetical protein